jgi:hypothetical protein
MIEYQDIIKRLNAFVRKYHKNELLKGSIMSLGMLLLFLLVLLVVEYLGEFGIITRSILFYTYLVLATGVLIRWILLPLFRIGKLSKSLTYAEASRLIGKYFPEINDKLLNTIQLHKLIEENPKSAELIAASIAQKSKELKPYPFKKAVDFKTNKKYLKYALIPLGIFLLIFMASPAMITEPAERIVKHNEYFEPKQDFHIKILNDALKTSQLEDFTLEITTEGERVPQQMFIRYKDNDFLCRATAPNQFVYTFRNLNESIDFELFAGDIRTKKYKLLVHPKPVISSFETQIIYPAYTGLKGENIPNATEFNVPEGSELSFRFYTRDTKNVIIQNEEIGKSDELKSANVFESSGRFLNDSVFMVWTSNEFIPKSDSMEFRIHCQKDQYADIQVQEIQDSVFDTRIYFRGLIEDDYGFSRLEFTVEREGKADIRKAIDINKFNSQQEFFHFFDLQELNLTPGESAEYYFKVWDNDGINGPKSSRSHKMIYTRPTRAQADSLRKEERNKLDEKFEEAIKDSREFQKQAEELQKKILQKKELDWQDKQQIADLLDKHKELEQNIEQIKEQTEINKKKSLDEEKSQRIAEKQEQLQKMFEELMNDEMKELFEQLEQMMDELNREKANDLLEQMQISDEELEEQLDRNMELLKQLQFESELQKSIDQLEEMAKEQEILAEETNESEDSELKEEQQKQEKLNEDFENLKEHLDELEQMNEELEKPNDFEKPEEQQEQISEDMEQSMEQMQQQNQKGASEKQKNASQKMKQMSQSLQQMMTMMQQQQMGEDIENLREILENLIQISFEQEELMDRTSKIKLQDPSYPELIREQNRLGTDIEKVEDSLKSLAKRQMAIEPHVTKKVKEIESNLKSAVDQLSERRPKMASGKQQYVFTAINDLALMLAEALDQMQDQQMSMQSSGQCNSQQKQGGSSQSQSMKSMSQLQEQLNKQLQEMQRQLQQQQNGKGQQKKGGQSMSEQFARASAQQQALRRKLEEYMEEMKEGGLQPGKEMRKIAEEMEQTETDLVNKILNRQTLQRQKDILTRLLKSEKAEREREKEKRREAREAKNKRISNPEAIFKYKREEIDQLELLRTIPPELKPYYKKKANKFLYPILDQQYE